MRSIRRAFLTASAGRYAVMLINLVATLTLARLLRPEDYGVSILGSTILATAEAICAIGGSAYIIQQPVLAAQDTRTTFTVSFLATFLLASCLAVTADPLAYALGTPKLAGYLRVILWGFLTGPFTYLVAALLSRQMAFGKLAIIGVLVALVNAVLSVTLSLLGFGCMSLAWANLVSAGAGMCFSLVAWRDWSIFRPDLRQWRCVMSFGAFNSTTAILAQLGQSLPYFIFAKMLNAEAVGLCQRTFLLCLVPERVILAGIGAIALPAFAQRVRDGESLKPAYLRALELLTAAQWPALILLICLADPIIRLLLGSQWHQIVPLTQMFAGALIFSAPLILTYPVLVALGAIRLLPPLVAVQIVVSAITLALAAAKGLHAVALSTFLIIPFSSLLSLLVVRRLVGLGWFELVAATHKSAGVSVLCAIGPVAAMTFIRHDAETATKAAIPAVIFCAIGWIWGLRITSHPLLAELSRAADDLQVFTVWQRYIARHHRSSP